MTEEEIRKKDWQVLTAYSNLTTIAHLRTIMQNQAVIISTLKGIPLEEIHTQMEEWKKANYEDVCNEVKKNISDYPPIF